MRTLASNFFTVPSGLVAVTVMVRARLEVVAGGDVEGFFAGQAERLPGLPFHELQRQNAHADQIAAMDALVAGRR